MYYRTDDPVYDADRYEEERMRLAGERCPSRRKRNYNWKFIKVSHQDSNSENQTAEMQ